jgi:hypothetical protein
MKVSGIVALLAAGWMAMGSVSPAQAQTQAVPTRPETVQGKERPDHRRDPRDHRDRRDHRRPHRPERPDRPERVERSARG